MQTSNKGFTIDELSLSILDQFLPPPPKEEEINLQTDSDLYIRREIPVDVFTTIRKRVKIHPGVCVECGLDLVELAHKQNRLFTQYWDELNPEQQETFKQVVAVHKQKAHTDSEKLITKGRPTQWLSGRDLGRK